MLTSESNYLDIDLEYLERIIFKNCIEDDTFLNSIVDNLNYRFFKNKDLQQIIKLIQALYKKNKTVSRKITYLLLLVQILQRFYHV